MGSAFWIYQHGGNYAGKIFKGAKPTDLPVEQGVKFELVIAVLAKTRSDSRCLVERSGFGVRRDQAAIIFSFVIGTASRKVCIGVLPKHQRP